MMKMTMHYDHTIFRRFSEFRFSLVPTLNHVTYISLVPTLMGFMEEACTSRTLQDTRRSLVNL